MSFPLEYNIIETAKFEAMAKKLNVKVKCYTSFENFYNRTLNQLDVFQTNDLTPDDHPLKSIFHSDLENDDVCGIELKTDGSVSVVKVIEGKYVVMTHHVGSIGNFMSGDTFSDKSSPAEMQKLILYCFEYIKTDRKKEARLDSELFEVV